MQPLKNDIWTAVTSTLYWDCSIRTRFSTDWSPKSVFGHVSIRSEQVLLAGSLLPTQTITYTLEMQKPIASQEYLHVQFAMIYTDSEAIRKTRIHNARFKHSSGLADVYTGVDPYVLSNILSKTSLREIILTNNLESGSVSLKRLTENINSEALSVLTSLPENIQILNSLIQNIVAHPLFSTRSLASVSLSLDYFNFLKYQLETLTIN